DGAHRFGIRSAGRSRHGDGRVDLRAGGDTSRGVWPCRHRPRPASRTTAAPQCGTPWRPGRSFCGTDAGTSRLTLLSFGERIAVSARLATAPGGVSVAG